jgi:hypothetical protein
MAPKLMSLNNLLSSKERFLILLCLILGLHVLVPILNRFTTARIFLELFLTAIAISMLYTISHKKYTISHKKGHVIVGMLLAIVMLASRWLQYFYPNIGILAIGMIAGALFIALVIASILVFIFRSEGINREIIYAAILLYLLAALMWAFVYTVIELVDPASFNIDLSRPQDYLLEFQYFSFVTITTLGYGDITPVTEVAKAITALEAVVGQLYLVVAVAWLVGMYVSKKSK